MMTTSKLLPILLGLAMLASFTGCALFNKGTVHYNRTTTIGRELLDLKEARDTGAMSEEEYVEVKKEIMRGGPIELNLGIKE